MEFIFSKKLFNINFYILVTLAISLVNLVGCTSLIYQPDHYLHADPHAFGIKFKEYFVNSLDGTKLLAWDMKSKTADPENLILMFHGNAENLSSHIFNLTWMLDHSTDLLIFDYRGYGLSQGTPYPKGVWEDGQTFLKIAYEKFKAGHYKRFIIYTQSLGGSIAMSALEKVSWRDEVSLLVLDSTFRSPTDVANEKTKNLLGWLISSEYTASQSLSHLTMPLLVIHSFKDPVVNFKFGEDIFLKAPSLKKTFWRIENGSHGDVFFVNKGEYQTQFLHYLKGL